MSILGFLKRKDVEMRKYLYDEEKDETEKYVNLIGEAKRAQMKWQELGTAMVAQMDSKYSLYFGTEEQLKNAKEEFKSNFKQSISKLEDADKIWGDMNKRQKRYCKASCEKSSVSSAEAISELDTYHKDVKGQAAKSILKTIITRDLNHILGESYFTEKPSKVIKELKKEFEEMEESIKNKSNSD